MQLSSYGSTALFSGLQSLVRSGYAALTSIQHLVGALPDRDEIHDGLLREQASWDPVKKQAKYPDAKSAFTLIASDLLSEHPKGAIGMRKLPVVRVNGRGTGYLLSLSALSSYFLAQN